MDLYVESRGERRKTLFAAIVLALIVGIVVPPAVEAAVQKVKLAGGTATAKIKDSGGAVIESEAVPAMGVALAPGSDGAVAVRNYAGGGGVLGLGDCDDVAEDGIPSTVTVTAGPSSIATAILLTGTDAVVEVTAPAFAGPNVLLRFRTDAGTPNLAFSLGNGLSINAADLVFTCTAAAADGEFVILGQ